MLFRRVFSSTMRPDTGLTIDSPGRVPDIYAPRTPSNFEKELWQRFWEIANNDKVAKEYGVRAIHGDAPYMRMQPAAAIHTAVAPVRDGSSVELPPQPAINHTTHPLRN